MADQRSGEGSSTANVSGECSDSTVELNIKTLDSRVYSFQVDKNMPVPLFKEKIANETGVPAGQQRLIFRGKVLKDNHLLSDYHVENGHTLHLVLRQLVQSQASSATSPGETNGNNSHQATDASTGGSRNRIGQISHSVVLGTFNVGEQGEGIVPDITRVIGAVLNSIGVGNQAATNISGSTQPVTTPSNANSFSQGNQTQGTQVNVNSQNQPDNQAQSALPSLSQPFQSLPHFFSIPPGAHAVTIPSVNAPIPDSLHTIFEFMNHLEQTMVQNGYRPRSSSDSSSQQPRMDLPSNAQGLHTPEALSIVLRQAERLLSGHAVSALSHIAGCLEQDNASSDPTVRGQIQTESVQVGLAMQHLGALLLELGRTILTLRMGQTPAESAINAGPAVYISPSGPNPIMVQPFPLQTSSLFGGSVPSANPPAFAPVGIGNAPRNVNIHIHAGASPPILSAVGTRGSSGDGTQGERRSGNSTGDASAPQGFHMRNIIATAVPSRPASVVASFPGQPGPNPTFSVSQPSSDSSIPSIVAEINSRVSSIVANMQGDNLVRSGQDQPNVQDSPITSGSDAVNEHSSAPMVSGEHSSSLPAMPQGEGQGHKEVDCVSGVKDYSTCSDEGPGSCSSGKINSTSGDGSRSALQPVERPERTEDARAVPLGLGIGTLERRKQGKQEKSLPKSGDGTTSSSKDQNSQPSTQQILQALAARSSAMNRINVNSPSSEQLPSGAGQVTDSRSMQGQSRVEDVDMTNVVSQVLHSPALNSVLTGVSEQTGVGSPDILRNMLQQLTQSPQMMNAVNQIAHQFEGQDVGNMFAGMGGQGGGFDLSRMFQQMMPIVSQALGSSSTTPQTSSVLEPQPSRDQHTNQSSQIDVQRLAQRIEQLNSPQGVFRDLVESSLQSTGDEIDSELLVEALCSDEDLVNEYIELLQREIRDRHQF